MIIISNLLIFSFHKIDRWSTSAVRKEYTRRWRQAAPFKWMVWEFYQWNQKMQNQQKYHQKTLKINNFRLFNDNLRFARIRFAQHVLNPIFFCTRFRRVDLCVSVSWHGKRLACSGSRHHGTASLDRDGIRGRYWIWQCYCADGRFAASVELDQPS